MWPQARIRSGVHVYHTSISTEVLQVDSCSESQPPSNDVPYIRAFWATLTEQQRQDFFTVDIEELQETALEITTHTRKSMYIYVALLTVLTC